MLHTPLHTQKHILKHLRSINKHGDDFFCLHEDDTISHWFSPDSCVTLSDKWGVDPAT
jgi:hypothetical protein